MPSASAVGSAIESENASSSSPTRSMSPSRFRVVVALFALSGAAGLVDQVCFSKYLSYVVGSTAYAVSAVLAAFMGGLAFGAHVAGRFAGRLARPLVGYGVMEIVAGVAVAAAPFGFQLLTPAYVALAQSASGSLAALSVVRWLLATALVALPTFALGTTLPLLSPALGGTEPSHASSKKVRLGALYASNTLGGAVGALAAAFVILPTLGLRGTLFASGAASILCGAIALAVGRRIPNAESATTVVPPTSESPQPARTTLSVLSFASGALIFAVEVVATHLLAVIVGNSAYAFGLILAIFLLCLFAGAAWAPRFDHRYGAAALPASLLASAGLLTLTLPMWDRLPYVFGDLGDVVTTFAGRETVRSLVAFSILCLPVTFMGLTFPLLLQGVARERDVGFHVGRLTAINTLGAVSGALATGYLLLPGLGSRGTLLATVVAFCACAVLTTTLGPRRSWPAPTAAVAIAVCATLMPSWSLARLTAGSNVYFDHYEAPDAVIFAREDVQGGITTVTRSRDGVKTLYTNGKFQGNDGWEMQAQRFFAHYPSLFVQSFDRALVIGLGTATTLGTYAAYPWRHIDVVEISPSIVEAASTHFSTGNRGSLHDPRVHLTIADGRNYLLLSRERYDLIGMELSSVWFAGASSLYSAEYYRLVRERLEPNGIFQQWVQLHHVYDPVFATLLNTLRQVFPHVALFYGGGQGILVASGAPLHSSRRQLDALQRIPHVLETLPEGRRLGDLFADLLVHDEALDAFLGEVAQESGRDLAAMVSTDDNLYLEYQTPRGNVLPWIARELLVERIRRHRPPSGFPELVVP